MKNGFSFLILILLIIIPSATLMSEDLPLLAVPSISAVGVSETLAATSRNIVETALIKTGKFMVLSYTDMEEILEAQAFSLSGCTDESCAIEIGELLAADNIVVGDLSAVGDGMVLSIRLVNVTTSQTVNGEVVTIADVASMQDSVFSAAYALAGMKYAGGSAVEEVGSIYVKAPQGMELDVSVNGTSYGRTPVLIEDLPFGVHLLEAEADDYLYKSEISVSSKDIMEITADIELLRGNLFLIVQPAPAEGYEILIDGESSKPGLTRELPVGRRDVLISGGGWYFRGDVLIETGKTSRLTAELVKAGTLQFFGPEGISAEIVPESGGSMSVADAGKPLVLPAGRYSYTINHEDYETITGQIDVGADEASEVRPEYEHNERWAIKQRIAELEAKRQEFQGARDIMLPIAWVFTGLGGAALGTGGGIEIAIQLAAQDLSSTYDQYSSSTDAEEIGSLGDTVFRLEEDIKILRPIRDYSLLGGGISLAVGGLLFFLTPAVEPIEAEIAELEGRLK